jgi:hypothetical protein
MPDEQYEKVRRMPELRHLGLVERIPMPFFSHPGRRKGEGKRWWGSFTTLRT